MRHINIPVFIPHLGCPNQCIFCNQRSISGVERFEAERVRPIIDEALSTVSSSDHVEIAFFGGSFTGIDRALMIELLEIASEYIKNGRVHSIRCSTRPDYINEEILQILKNYGVKNIELGLQSSSDTVLSISKRGHTSLEEKRACDMILRAGFGLTGQMMIGLPGSNIETELATAEFIISAGCNSARIYPTVVFNNTELCDMAKCGEYIPLALDDAVERSALVLKRFLDAGVEVIRIGLCSSENLVDENVYFAGPNHPALGELVENRLYYEKIYEKASGMKLDSGNTLRVAVSRGNLSKAVGQRKRNKLLLSAVLGVRKVIFTECDTLSGYEISLSAE